MRWIALVLAFLFIGCKRSPDLYINGKPYMFVKKCIESHDTTEMRWTGKFAIYVPVEVCDKYKIDTVELK